MVCIHMMWQVFWIAKGFVCVHGNHCAQPLMRFLKIDSTCHASFYFYNTKEDVDRLVCALEKVFGMFEKYIKK